MARTARGVALAVLVLAAGCSRQSEVAPSPQSGEKEVASHAVWSPIADADMTEAQKARQQRCTEAVQALSGRLMGELTKALDEGGPAAAIDVCRMRAPEIAAAVSNEYGLVLGRTSFRLRNPSNMPPEWAEDLVRQQVAEPTWMVGPNGQLGGMLPIRLKAECGMCHGPKEQIAPEVLAAIEETYPEDTATGFHEGELRGWFWVEAPATS
jgi:hypothetical protein